MMNTCKALYVKERKFGNLFVIEDRGQIQTILSLTFVYYIYRSNQKILLIAVSLNGTQVGHESQLKFPFARNKYNFFEGECIHQRNFLKEQATEEIFKRCNKMSCKILKNEYTTCRLIEHDGQWSIVERLVMHNRHKTPNNYLRVHDGGVLGCTASCQNATRFKVYEGIKPFQEMMTVLFECMDGPSQGLMICHANGELSLKRNSVTPIVNLDQADDDIRFYQKTLQSGNRMFKRPAGGYMRFDEYGRSLPLRDINEKGKNSWEGKFMLREPKTCN